MIDFKYMPPIQFKLTSDSANYNVFENAKIASELLRLGLTSEIIYNKNAKMQISILPDTPCSVICNDREYDAPDYYGTGGYVNIKSLKIKESGISFLITISIA